jgi:hypothetical protein
MGEERIKWFLPVLNSLGDGLAFPVSEDVRSVLRGMRNGMGWQGEGEGEDVMEDEADNREYRRDDSGRWMMHD